MYLCMNGIYSDFVIKIKMYLLNKNQNTESDSNLPFCFFLKHDLQKILIVQFDKYVDWSKEIYIDTHTPWSWVAMWPWL